MKDYAGWSPLHEACGSGNKRIIEILIENNADINLKGSKDSTPLHEAILNNHLDCAKYLLERGADTTIRNSHGFLAKDFLKNCKNANSLIKLFESVESKKDVNVNVVNTELLSEPSLSVAKGRGKRALRAKQITVYPTGMSEEEKGKLSESGKKLNFKLVREMSANGLYN